MKKTFWYVLALAELLTTGAMAFEKNASRVATMTDWSVFVEDNPTECWGASTSREMANSQDVRVDAVSRGQTVFMAYYRPSEGAEGHVAFTAGYPFASGSTVLVVIPGYTIELLTDGEWAWPTTTSDDSRLITAMKLGTNAIISARSRQGTVTKDTFSLWGFTAAFADAAKRCGF